MVEFVAVDKCWGMIVCKYCSDLSCVCVCHLEISLTVGLSGTGTFYTAGSSEGEQVVGESPFTANGPHQQPGNNTASIFSLLMDKHLFSMIVFAL